MREEFLPFHRPSIGDEEIREVTDVLRTGWLTTGPMVRRFEKEFAEFVGASHAVAANSGTAALHLSLAACGLGPGDEVIVPTMTFTATAEVVVLQGARPVLVDCRRDTFNLDELAFEEAISNKSRAVMPVHMAGQSCEMDSILDVAGSYGLKVVVDAAHALPAEYRGKAVGAMGDMSAFSFYSTKTLTTGEGGMVTTDNLDYAERMRVQSLHGISKDAWNRYTSEGSWYYQVLEAGFKYNMTDVAAAMGVHQLRKAEEFWRRRSEIAQSYSEAFRDLEGVVVPKVQTNVRHAWHLYIVLLNLEMLSIDRAQFIDELKVRNIGTSVHFIPLHLHPFYQNMLGYKIGDFPNAEWVYQRCISLPIYPAMSDQDVADVIEAVGDVAEERQR